MLGLTYQPLANAVFQTAPIGPSDWTFIVLAAMVSLGMAEIEKRIRRMHKATATRAVRVLPTSTPAG